MPRLAEKMDGPKRIVQYLTAKRHKFYSFDTKDARPFKVVLKGLSNDQTLLEIRSEITGLVGFTPSQVVLMKKKSNSTRIQKFVLNFIWFILTVMRLIT